MAKSDRPYLIEIKRSAAKEIEAIDGRSDRRRILERIAALAEDPFPPGTKKLTGTRNRFRLRKGSFRIVYEVIREALIVFVVKVGDRKSVY